VQGLEPGAKAKDLLAGTRLVTLPGFAGRTTDSGPELDATWSPDSASIVFSATAARDTAAYAEVPVHSTGSRRPEASPWP
jgi:hypothetical protein